MVLNPRESSDNAVGSSRRHAIATAMPADRDTMRQTLSLLEDVTGIRALRRFPVTGRLPKAAAFWVLARAAFDVVLSHRRPPSPFGTGCIRSSSVNSAATLTAVCSRVYVLVLLVTLLFLGSVSDYLGRIPVIIAALIFSLAGCAGLPGGAQRLSALYVARSLQGIATGPWPTGPIGAALIDLQAAWQPAGTFGDQRPFSSLGPRPGGR